jgi:hypothetical protein
LLNSKSHKDREKIIMNIRRQTWMRASLVLALALLITAASTRLQADSGSCGGQNINLPFTDVAGNAFFCQIASAYFSGLTNGTTATTYSPTQTVTREQMAAFITRTQDSALRRGSRRAALNQWSSTFSSGGQTTVGAGPISVQSDGADLWVANNTDGTVSRVRASDGKLLETWTAADGARGVLVARGRIFVTGHLAPGKLYRIDPQQPAGAVTVVTSSLGDFPLGITTDGNFIWTANSGGSVSKVDPGNGDVTTFTTGFSAPSGILYDGTHVWVTEFSPGRLLKLNPDGTIAQTVNVGTGARNPTFDGTSIWIPNSVANTVTVVRVKDAQGNPLPAAFVLTTLDGNGLLIPITAAFDGQRILITNSNGDNVSLWKATDLTPLGSFSSGTDTNPFGACSDGLNFWVTLQDTNKLARF